MSDQPAPAWEVEDEEVCEGRPKEDEAEAEVADAILCPRVTKKFSEEGSSEPRRGAKAATQAKPQQRTAA